MVRTGKITNPSQWYWCGYNEIQKPRRKNILIAYEKFSELAGYDSFELFQAAHRKWINASLTNCENKRQSQLTESIAVGSNKFVNKSFLRLGSLAKGRKIIEAEQAFQIREEMEPYNTLFGGGNCNIDAKNTYKWK